MADASLKATFRNEPDPDRDGAPAWFLDVDRDGATYAVPIYANEAASVGRERIRRLVVLIHGDRRRADDYIAALLDGLPGDQTESTAIVAPHFPVLGDLTSEEAQTGALYWSTHGWKEGAQSRSTPLARAWRASSFEIVDGLIQAAMGPDSWPSLAEVVLVGHSAGGQFVQRYAAGTTVDSSTARPLLLLFVVANPSSYLYFSPDRYVPSSRAFEPLTPALLQQCGGADRYKYGLRGRNQYMSRDLKRTIRARYAGRRVLYVAGAQDVDLEDERLDTSCAANLQGASRYERALRYYQYVGHEFGEEAYRRHRLLILPHVDHDVRAVFAADPVREAIFGADSLRSWGQVP